MSPDPEPDEELTAAEQGLVQHLEIVRAAPPAGTSLVHRVVRAARLQRGLREPLRAVGVLARAVVDGLSGLFGVRRERRQ